MYTRMRIMTSMQNYWDSIARAKELIGLADRVIIGIGAGLSAAGGLCYSDPALGLKWYPEYHCMGLKTIGQIMGSYWDLRQCKAESYWGFWAQHIWHMRYEAEATAPYIDLLGLVSEKDYFICTTNVDSQVEKAGFDLARIFAPQGNYGYFQCSKPCSNELYDNEDSIKVMTEHMPDPFAIRTEDIPLCPRCNRPLIPNLRSDDRFVEKPHLLLAPEYEDFVMQGQNESTLFLELGVGYNTPVIIRFPFESLTKRFAHAHLIRINSSDADVPKEIASKAICIKADLARVLHDLR